MYSKIAEEEDDKMVERWQKDAEGIIIFVRPELPFSAAAYSSDGYRTVYSLLSLLRLSLYPSKISGPIRRTFPHSISETSFNFLPIPTFLA